MSAFKPIGINKGISLQGPRYMQDNKGIDQANMVTQLSREPEAASAANTSQGLQVLAVILGAAGGAMVGWPIGQAISGERKPLWPLAAVGAGVIVLAVPFEILSVLSMDNAVKSHNRTVRALEVGP
jgi:hypothetical protein